MKHNLIIADDHKMFLDGLLSILKQKAITILYLQLSMVAMYKNIYR
ncbi:hypothetical protein JCM19274_2508 [Algibacter lectus]|uniref:Response regulatory domain-containing protein n=1 Tax=Algibacter lectus TaxID=221126 RepID=A0A090WS38_9FLAO|nr:hypothetical protein JCM19274_2508 [Algibacter lectus]